MISKHFQSHLHIEPCQPTDLRALYPLMRHAAPQLALREWLQFARRRLERKDGKAGILVARRSGKGLPCGAVCWRLTHDLRLGNVLEAEHFITLDLLYPEAVLLALSEALDELAVKLNCAVVRAIIYQPEAVIMRNFGWNVHSNGLTMLIKHVA